MNAVCSAGIKDRLTAAEQLESALLSRCVARRASLAIRAGRALAPSRGPAAERCCPFKAQGGG